MFNAQNLREALDLHERAFALLRWVRESLKLRRLSFSTLHQSTDAADAAQEWIGRHLANIPAAARPERSQLPDFARLFVAFLRTSYKLNSNAVRRVASHGCYCDYCSFLQAGPNLELRNPSRKAFATAHTLKRLYLTRLAEEIGVPNSAGAVDALLAERDLAETIAQVTWGAELLRRAEFSSQGEAVLALWRQFAWTGGAPRARFHLSVEQILAAEKRLIAAFLA